MKGSDSAKLFLNLRLVTVLLFSGILLFADGRSKFLSDLRYYVETALYPVLLFADSPNSLSHAVSAQFTDRSALIEENERLSTENYLQRVDIMRLRALEQENAAMRRLLNSPVHEDSKRMFAEVISVDSDPFSQRIVVNRGSGSGVYIGMPVITDQGLVGQVVSTAYASSRILLFSDPESAIPVVNTRNQVRAIVSGTGMPDELVIDNMPRSSDIQPGDLLVTSGLGGVYPKGYPVAVVTSVGFSEDLPFAEVKAKPLVDTDKIRYVLMFWYEHDLNSSSSEDAVPKEQTDAKRRLRQNNIKRLIESMTDDNRANSTTENGEAPSVVR